MVTIIAVVLAVIPSAAPLTVTLLSLEEFVAKDYPHPDPMSILRSLDRTLCVDGEKERERGREKERERERELHLPRWCEKMKHNG